MSRTLKFALALLVCTVAWSAAAVTAWQDQAFRRDVDLLQLDVTVLDAERQPIRGLTAKDFTVFVDGKARPIQALTEVKLPVRPPGGAPWMAEVAPDIVTNMRPDAGRVVIVMVDPRWAPETNFWAQKIARSIVSELGPSDLATLLYSLNIPFRTSPGFTNDRTDLISAIDRMPQSVGETELDALCYCGTCIHEALIRAADSVRELWRQKTMFVIGSRLTLKARTDECIAPVDDARERMYTALDRSNLTVHYLDPVGLRTLATQASSSVVLPPTLAIAAAQDRRQDEMIRFGDLGVVTARTGGRNIGSNFAERTVPSIFSETSSYYLAGIEPPAPRRDGQDIKIEVTVRQRGALVNARRTYVPATSSKLIVSTGLPDDVPKPLWEAMATTWPSNGRVLTLTAAPLDLLPSGKIALAAIVAGRWTPPPTRPGSAPAKPGSVEVVAGAFNRDGKSLATHFQTVQLPESVAMRPNGEFEIVSRLLVDPGLQEVRVALRSADGQPTGSVYTNVNVPDFAKAPVSLSAVALTAGPGATSASADLLEGLLPFTPTARRTFVRRDDVSGIVQVFEGADEPAADVELSTRIVGEDDQPAFSQTTTLRAVEFESSHSVQHRFDLPVDTLGPGEYLLTIEVVRGEHRAKRQLRFRVE
jgi:VWFA-related protein